MSDNLKAAKECGATVLKDGCVIFHHSTQLDTYTSRILASQQAAHEAEIGRLKEEVAELTLQRNVAITSRNAWQRQAESALEQLRSQRSLAMKDEAQKLEPLRAQVALLRDVLEGTGLRWPHIIEAISNTQATAEQFIAECEQRGAVKALEGKVAIDDCFIDQSLIDDLYVAGFTTLATELQGIAELRATSKKAG